MNESAKKILVADDETDIREALAAGLRIAGLEVFEAADGRTALSLARQEQPDLILLDIRMPGMTGIEVLRALRADEWGKGVHVIVLTAQTDVNDISEVIQVSGGDVEYLIKTDWRLSDVVDRVLNRLKEIQP